MHGCKSARIIATFTLRKLQNSTNSPETQDDIYKYFHTQMIARFAQQTDLKGNTTILKLDSLLVDLGFGTLRAFRPQRFSVVSCKCHGFVGQFYVAGSLSQKSAACIQVRHV